MQDVPLNLKNTLRSLRVKLGYTQAEAAELLEITTPTLRSWEKDSTTIKWTNVERIESVYRTPRDYIFFGREVSFSEQIKKNRILGGYTDG